jgi:hypothetical protein
VEIERIQQRPGNALAVLLDLLWRAAALAFHVAVKTARVWVSF